MNAELKLQGSPRRWELTDTDDGQRHEFDGVLLGSASSQRKRHDHGTPGRCSACRWFEVRIIRALDDTGGYVVSFQGFTTRANEEHRHTVHRTRSAHTVIELLTQVRKNYETNVMESFIPRTSRLALSEAAGQDEDVERAWIDRAIA